MSQSLDLRCQTKSGRYVIKGLTTTSTVGKLKTMIAEVTKISSDCIKVKTGYPPQVITFGRDSDQISSLPIRSGDVLIVEEDQTQRKRKIDQVDDALQEQINRSSGMLMRKVVPANNSCLFTSIDCVMNDGKVDLSSAEPMRELIAGIVMSDPSTYNEAFLGKSNSEYCRWIMNTESWGGAIEISILAQYYSTEIDVVDTQTGRIDRFGEDKNYLKRVLVLYDGIHYDPLVMEPLVPGEPLQTMFSTQDHAVLEQALDIADEAKAARQYTDVAKFSLRCLVCQKALVGQKEAQEHAKSTGHINFGEY